MLTAAVTAELGRGRLTATEPRSSPPLFPNSTRSNSLSLAHTMHNKPFAHTVLRFQAEVAKLTAKVENDVHCELQRENRVHAE